MRLCRRIRPRPCWQRPGQVAWQVFDAKTKHLLRDEYRMRNVTKFSADTLEELADKIEEIDKAQFLATIREFNAAVRQDMPFDPNVKDGRSAPGLEVPRSNWACTIATLPYTAYAVTCGVTFTFGGVRVTKRGASRRHRAGADTGPVRRGRNGRRHLLFQLSRRQRLTQRRRGLRSAPGGAPAPGTFARANYREADAEIRLENETRRAANGLTGVRDMLEAPYGGFCSTYADKYNLGYATDGLGTDFEMRRNGFKQYSSLASSQTSVDALRAIRARMHNCGEDVAAVLIETTETVSCHCGWPYVPAETITAQMNLPYTAAVTLLEGTAFVDQYVDEKLRDPKILDLAGPSRSSSPPPSPSLRLGLRYQMRAVRVSRYHHQLPKRGIQGECSRQPRQRPLEEPAIGRNPRREVPRPCRPHPAGRRRRRDRSHRLEPRHTAIGTAQHVCSRTRQTQGSALNVMAQLTKGSARFSRNFVRPASG